MKLLVAKFVDTYNIVGLDLHPPQRSTVAATFEEVDLTSDRSVTQILKRIRKRHGTRIAQ